MCLCTKKESSPRCSAQAALCAAAREGLENRTDRRTKNEDLRSSVLFFHQFKGEGRGAVVFPLRGQSSWDGGGRGGGGGRAVLVGKGEEEEKKRYDVQSVRWFWYVVEKREGGGDAFGGGEMEAESGFLDAAAGRGGILFLPFSHGWWLSPPPLFDGRRGTRYTAHHRWMGGWLGGGWVCGHQLSAIPHPMPCLIFPPPPDTPKPASCMGSHGRVGILLFCWRTNQWWWACLLAGEAERGVIGETYVRGTFFRKKRADPPPIPPSKK